MLQNWKMPEDIQPCFMPAEIPICRFHLEMHQLPAFGSRYAWWSKKLVQLHILQFTFRWDVKEEILLTAGNYLSSFGDYCKLYEAFHASNDCSCVPSLRRKAELKEAISKVFLKNLTLLLGNAKVSPMWSLRQLLLIHKVMTSVYPDILVVVRAAWKRTSVGWSWGQHSLRHAAVFQVRCCKRDHAVFHVTGTHFSCKLYFCLKLSLISSSWDVSPSILCCLETAFTSAP